MRLLRLLTVLLAPCLCAALLLAPGCGGGGSSGGGNPAVNQAPVVNAGPDRAIELGQAAALQGNVTDDGLPNSPGACTVAWSQVSGPGTAVFADPAAAVTTAGFSATGAYVLRLTAQDGALAGEDTVSVTVNPPATPGQDDAVFVHHSVGSNWLGSGLDAALVAKSYVDERNDVTYGTALAPAAGRPASLGGVPGDNTNMNHWVLWFNDYLTGLKALGSANGSNRIIMFKSCYPISAIGADGTEPGDPFSGSQTLANYRAVYRHPNGAGQTYLHGGYTYGPLEEVFAAHPEVLFIPVTAPPLHWGPSDATNDADAHRARLFNNWLKNTWLPAYHAAHPGLNNVAVFDFFDVLAFADNDPAHPNRLRTEYGGNSGDSHPNNAGSTAATAVFAGAGGFLDAAWATYPH